jgi:hypothetical protein
MRYQSAAAGAVALLSVLGPSAGNASTITQTFGFGSSESAGFSQFNPALGTLTAVIYSYPANLVDTVVLIGTGNLSFELLDPTGNFSTGPIANAFVSGANGAANLFLQFRFPSDTALAQYVGLGVGTLHLQYAIGAGLAFSPEVEGACLPGFRSCSPQMVVTYTYTPATTSPAATPLPAALPLFATGLGALGFLGWRRKRKNGVAIAAA